MTNGCSSREVGSCLGRYPVQLTWNDASACDAFCKKGRLAAQEREECREPTVQVASQTPSSRKMKGEEDTRERREDSLQYAMRCFGLAINALAPATKGGRVSGRAA